MSNMQKKSAFIVTKPLQLMVAMSLIEQLDLKAVSDFLIVDAFANAEDVAQRLQKYSNFGRSIFCDSFKKAYRIAKKRCYQHLYIDSDVGLRQYAQLVLIKVFHRKKEINVYEEGLGTYRNDLYHGTRKYFLDLIGAGTYFGGCSLTSKFYAYRPEEYKIKLNVHYKKVEEIRKPLEQFILENIDILRDIFNFREIEKIMNFSMFYDECHVYLSSWTIDNSIMKDINGFSGLKLLKPHPHIKNNKSNEGFLTIPAYIPAELLLIKLLEVCKKINVYHHGTSASRYINSDRIHFVNKKFNEERY